MRFDYLLSCAHTHCNAKGRLVRGIPRRNSNPIIICRKKKKKTCVALVSFLATRRKYLNRCILRCVLTLWVLAAVAQCVE